MISSILKFLKPRLLSSQGNILAYIVMTMVIFGVLGVTMVSLFSTSITSSAVQNDTRRATYLSEAGTRYAMSELLTGDFSKTAITNLNATTYTVNPAGRFNINVFSPWFELFLGDPTIVDYDFVRDGSSIPLKAAEGQIPPGFSNTIPTGKSTDFFLVNYDYFTTTAPPRPSDTAPTTTTTSPTTTTTSPTTTTTSPTTTSGTCSPTPADGLLGATITANRTSGVAPLAVFFEAKTNSALTRPFHDIVYGWKFGDSSVPWSRGAQVGGPGVNDKNLTAGPVAAHVFEKPGTYTVCLTAFDGKNTAETAVQITVTDFSAANTFCINAIGSDYTGCPIVGSGRLYADSAACVTGKQCLTQASWATIVGTHLATNKKVLLKGGDTFTLTTSVTLSKTGPAMIGSYGAGKANISQTGGTTPYSGVMTLGNTSDIRMVDLAIDGNDGGYFNAVRGYGAIKNFTLLRIDVTDMSGIELPIDEMAAVIDGFFLVDSTFASMSSGNSNNHGLLVAATNAAIMGNSFDGTGQSAMEHHMRLQFLNKAVVSHNTMQVSSTFNGSKEMLSLRAPCSASCGGGSGSYYPTKGLDGANAATRYVVISDNLVKTNTYAGIQIAQVNPNDSTLVRDVIIERNWLPSASGGGSQIRVTGKDISIRNNFINLTNAAVGARIGIEVDGATAGLAAPDGVYLYNNTIYSGATNDMMGVYIKRGNNIQLKNNIAYAPNATTSYVMRRGVVAAASGNTNDANDPSTNVKTSPGFTNGSGSIQYYERF